LGEFYNALQKSKGAKALEIVFVSSDHDEASFTSYYGEHAAWAALPFSNREAKNALSAKFKVKGIPAFVLVDGLTGELLTADGRAGVADDFEGKDFPWKPPTLDDVLANLPNLQSKKGHDVPFNDLKNKPLLLYFSAHWCPPCRGFTPVLVEFFDTLQTAHPSAEIVFVSSDRGVEAFDEYYAEMGQNWLALPFGHSARAQLSKLLDVSGIPSLVLLSAESVDGKRAVITKGARGMVSDGIVQGFPNSWKDKPYADLSKTVECGESDINETPALCVLVEGVADAAQQAKAVASLKEVASEASEPLLFFFATNGEGPVGQVRKLVGAPAGPTATLLKLDIPDSGGFYIQHKVFDVTPEVLRAFLANPGARNQLGS